jgi:D-alanyl-D-alanine carboxypeptidase
VTHLLLAAWLAFSHSQAAQIDAIVERTMRERHVAGLSLGIARSGRRVYLRGYGLRDVPNRLPADGYTIYQVGSIGKQFAAAMALQEAAAGRVALSGSVRSYAAAPDVFQPVTIAQLLGQTSGISSSGDLAHATLAFDPGTGWLYDNANYALLGIVLQSVAGVGYPTLLHDRLAAPLSLFSTGCRSSPYARNAARGYVWPGHWREAPATNGGRFDRTCSAVELLSNAADLVRWLENLREGRVVSAASFVAMTTSGKLTNGMPTHYGFGFFVSDWFGYTVAEHPGFVSGFSSQDALVLADGLAIAVLTNADAVDLTPLTESIVAVLDKPLDRNLSASPGRAPQNENPRITAELKAILQSPRYASFGPLQLVEFIERSVAGGTTYDKYRLTRSTGQWWATVGYRGGAAIESLSLMPI